MNNQAFKKGHFSCTDFCQFSHDPICRLWSKWGVLATSSWSTETICQVEKALTLSILSPFLNSSSFPLPRACGLPTWGTRWWQGEEVEQGAPRGGARGLHSSLFTFNTRLDTVYFLSKSHILQGSNVYDCLVNTEEERMNQEKVALTGDAGQWQGTHTFQLMDAFLHTSQTKSHTFAYLDSCRLFANVKKQKCYIHKCQAQYSCTANKLLMPKMT